MLYDISPFAGPGAENGDIDDITVHNVADSASLWIRLPYARTSRMVFDALSPDAPCHNLLHHRPPARGGGPRPPQAQRPTRRRNVLRARLPQPAVRPRGGTARACPPATTEKLAALDAHRRGVSRRAQHNVPTPAWEKNVPKRRFGRRWGRRTSPYIGGPHRSSCRFYPLGHL